MEIAVFRKRLWLSDLEDGRCSGEALALKIMMTPIEEIKSFLSNYPDLNIEETTNSIVVLQKDYHGFKVQFKQWKNGYILSYGNWHEYLPKSEIGAKIAVGLFKFGLSDSCKLTIYRKGNVDYKRSLSYKDPNVSQWIIIANQKILIYLFLKSRRNKRTAK